MVRHVGNFPLTAPCRSMPGTILSLVVTGDPFKYTAGLSINIIRDSSITHCASDGDGGRLNCNPNDFARSTSVDACHVLV
jgi:hypothetical protein